MIQNFTLYPTALSGTSDGTTATANGASMALGYSAASTAGLQAQLRFDTHLVSATWSGTDLASTGTPWTALSSASYVFGPADVGQTIYITGAGTNFIIGAYKIVSVTAGVATVSVAAGSTGACTNGVWFLGPFGQNTVVGCNLLATVTAVGTGGTVSTDLASTNGTSANPVVTSVTRAFNSFDVGQVISITAGTSWTVATYTIISVSAGAATLSAACGSSASLTAGTWKFVANPNIALWGANYRSALGNAEYNVASNNLKTEYRMQVTPNFVPAFTTATFAAAGGSPYSAVYVVPSRFLNAGQFNSNTFPQTLVGSDLATSTPWTTVTSASYYFTQNDVGQPLNILAGTANFTAGIYTITSVSAGAATLDRACGSTGASTGGIYFMSGTCDLELRPFGGMYTNYAVTVQGPSSATNYTTGIYNGYSYKPTLLVTAVSALDMANDTYAYRTIGIGAESYFAYDIEPQEGVLVMGQNILDVDSIGLTQQAANLFGTALSAERAKPRKVAVGRTGAGGNISFELTPERWTKLLTGLMKITSILDSNGNELGNANTFNGPYTGTDLASTNATSSTPTVTSATRTFTISDVDETIVVTAGTNWTTGTYTILAVNNAGGATINKPCGTAASITGGTWTEGAATTDLSTISASTVATNQTLFSSTAPYTYTFKTCQSRQVTSFTGVVKKGVFRKVYPGLKISTLSFSVGLDQLIHATVDFAGLNEFSYDQTSFGYSGDELVLSPTAGYDTITNSVWSFVDGLCQLGGITDGYTQAASINLSNDLRERRGLNSKRNPISHFALGFSASANMTLYFANEVHLKNFLGVQFGGFPFRPGKVINFDSFSMTFARQDIPDLLQFIMPKATFITLSDPIQGEDVIMMSGDMIGLYDYSGTNTNMIITLQTNEVPTTFFPSTNYITVLPPDTNSLDTAGNLAYLPVTPQSPVIGSGGGGGGTGGGTGGSGVGTVGSGFGTGIISPH